MNASEESVLTRSRVRWGGGLVLAGVLVWVLFFDSHSLLQRYQWRQELEATRRENARLRHEIERFRTKLDRPLSDSTVERIARQQYGMKRPNETIYRIQSE